MMTNKRQQLEEALTEIVLSRGSQITNEDRSFRITQEQFFAYHDAIEDLLSGNISEYLPDDMMVVRKETHQKLIDALQYVLDMNEGEPVSTHLVEALAEAEGKDPCCY